MADILNNSVVTNPPVNTPPQVNTPVQPPVTPAATVAPANIVVNENPEDLDTRWTRWRCLNCNYTYEGRNPLKKCPRCGNEDPDKFDDVD